MKVFMKCVNIKNLDILGYFHYILNAPRNVSCSRTQHSDPGVARSRGPSISLKLSTLPLSNCAPKSLACSPILVHTVRCLMNQLILESLVYPFNTLHVCYK